MWNLLRRLLRLRPKVKALRGEDYPVLAKLWDNEDDAFYDDWEPEPITTANDSTTTFLGTWHRKH
ncbi:hypothetical protein LCGC14_0878270 [marine sediment metagenome]|uniref:Uncharacterized protein n=1 Tax=marine sediment metagenome TaxID=412755 RepID=A0A0F9PNA2_9ZZZZ